MTKPTRVSSNLGLVFSRIASADPDAPLSRARLATTTRLTKATVSSLVATLMDARLVVELRPSTHLHAGRPAIPLVVARGTVAALGLEINADFLGVRAVDLTGATLAESFVRADFARSDPAEAFAALVKHAYAIVRRLLHDRVRLVGACLALPGITDNDSVSLRYSPSLGWGDIDVRAAMTAALERLSYELFRIGTFDKSAIEALRTWLVGNLLVATDAALAARVETGRDHGGSFVYVFGETGIGAAIVARGDTLTGRHGWAGQLGHVVVDPRGPVCGCGASGCLETYAGKRALLTAAGLEPGDEIAALTRAYEAGLPPARQAVDQAAWALGIALADCLNLVDTDDVRLGGSLAALADAVRPGIAAQIAARVPSLRGREGDLEVRASDGDYPAATGGALTVLDRAAADPASVLWHVV